MAVYVQKLLVALQKAKTFCLLHVVWLYIAIIKMSLRGDRSKFLTITINIAWECGVKGSRIDHLYRGAINGSRNTMCLVFENYGKQNVHIGKGTAEGECLLHFPGHGEICLGGYCLRGQWELILQQWIVFHTSLFKTYKASSLRWRHKVKIYTPASYELLFRILF